MTAVPSIYEPLMTGILDLLEDALVPGTFRYVNRRLVTWEALTFDIQNGLVPFIQPALFLFDGVGLGGGRTKYEQRGRGRPTVRVLSRTIVCYAQLPGGGTPAGPDRTTPGGTVFAPLVEAIEGVFQQRDYDGAALTLNGIASHIWIEGESVWVTGELDPNGQGMFTLPLQIMVPY